MQLRISDHRMEIGSSKNGQIDFGRKWFLGASVAAIVSCLPVSAIAQQQSDVEIEENDEGLSLPRNSAIGEYALSISPKITYSDNVELDPENAEQADGLASIELRGGLLLDRVNFTGIVNGRIEVGSYFDPPTVAGQDLYDQFVVDQNIRAAGTAEIADNFLFIDIAAAAERQALDEGSRFSSQSIAANDQQADAYSFSLSPYLFSEFSNESSVEVRYRYINVLIDDSEAVQGIDNFLNDSESHEVITEYNSGKLLDRLSFSIRAYVNKTDETGSDVLPVVDYQQASVSGSILYPLNRKISLVGTVGVDDIQTKGNPAFDDGELSGAFWKAGFLATPGRRTDLRIEVGERFDGLLLDASAEYRYSSRLRFRGDISRSFNTGSQLRNRDASVLQSETLAFADDLRQLQELTASDILNRALQFNTDLSNLGERNSGLATTNNASFSVLANTGLNQFTLRAAYNDSDFGFEETDTISLNGAWKRRMTRNVDLYLRGAYQNSSTDISGTIADCIAALSTDPATAGLSVAAILQLCQNSANLDADTQTASVLAGLEYTIFRDISAFVQYARTQRFADTEQQEYKENAVTAGLTMDL